MEASKYIVPFKWIQTGLSENTMQIGILCRDFFILTLEQINVLDKYCTYNNKPIPKISDVKTIQNLCKMRYK